MLVLLPSIAPPHIKGCVVQRTKEPRESSFSVSDQTLMCFYGRSILCQDNTADSVREKMKGVTVLARPGRKASPLPLANGLAPRGTPAPTRLGLLSDRTLLWLSPRTGSGRSLDYVLNNSSLDSAKSINRTSKLAAIVFELSWLWRLSRLFINCRILNSW